VTRNRPTKLGSNFSRFSFDLAGGPCKISGRPEKGRNMMKRKVTTVWVLLMAAVIVYGLVKAISGDVAGNLPREVSGLMYTVCALAGLIGVQLSQTLSLQKRLNGLEQRPSA